MGIHIPDAETEQRLPIYEVKHFLVRGGGCLRQLPQGVQNEITLPQIAESRDKAMPENLPAVEQLPERMIRGPQMVDPDRGINQDHSRASRRRGAAARSGWLPPNRASRRALSRSINALSASRTRMDFSRSPV